jgi:hypothetical protein
MDLTDARAPEPALEARLRRHFAENGEARTPPRYDLAAVTLRRRRQLRRQRMALAGTALGVVLIAGGLPAVRAVLPVASHDATASSSPTSPAGPADLYDQPTRGSLAGDAGWLSALAARAWEVDPQAGAPNPPPATHRVVYAGDIPGERVALVLGRAGGKTAYLWLHGRTGADPGQLDEAASPELTGTGAPVALLDVPSGTATGAALVLVGLPGDTAEYVTADGLSSELHVVDGVAVARVPVPVDQQGTGRIHLTRAGRPPVTVVPDLSGLDVPVAATSLAIEDPRALRTRVDQTQLQDLGRYMTGFYHFPPGRLELVLLATGPVGDRQAILLGGVLPSGQTVAWQGSYDRAHPGVGTGAGTPPGPATPLLQQVLALPTDGGVVVSGPLDGVTAQLLDRSGAVVGTFPLENGAGVGTTSGPAARVRIADSAGVLLTEAAVRSTR